MKNSKTTSLNWKKCEWGSRLCYRWVDSRRWERV